ncbi:MAG: ADP-L-glycero-D-mannoheptose-6-epimerase, partial [Bacteroidetes bacterium]|nr:ADP-L-glycero-D-mannoheptose-6-epimerase [Bacteroidota bacterium]
DLNGIFNAGTGKARSFIDLVNAIFASLKLEPKIEFIPIPADIRDKYQYYTQAEMTKLVDLEYGKPFLSLEEGVKKYVEVLKSE